MLKALQNLDRRWIFLLMGLAVGVPILVIGITGRTFPETPTPLAQSVFDAVNELDAGDKVLLSFDYDPASEGELAPMATAFVRHCAQRKLKMYFMALWPVGPRMVQQNIRRVIEQDYPDLVYGEDYVDLGFKAGNEAVIKVIVTDLRQYFTTDSKGTPVEEIPMMREVRSVQDMDLLVNVSAGYPGSKEWVLYASTPFGRSASNPEGFQTVAGCTGVQAPLMYPYIPKQLAGLLGAIKGAAEYEFLVNEWVREQRIAEALVAGGMAEAEAADLATTFAKSPGAAEEWTVSGAAASMSPEAKSDLIRVADAPIPGKYLEGQRRMGPQLVAHLLMVLLIIVGNVIFFMSRKRGGAR
ncbi:MAG: hypothetical protein O2927_06165 [Planctomycetota bacterium]|nr:hypothetical protein [Planctomycetota bacterium]